MPVAVRCQGVRYASRTLRTDAVVLLAAIGRPRAELSVLLCDDEFIRELNAQWRQKDIPTDVLSFSMGGGDLLGDVVISLDTAKRQAGGRGHDLHTELRVLLVHGLLHLCDHDHEKEADNARMAAEENRLLTALGVSGVGLVTRVSG